MRRFVFTLFFSHILFAETSFKKPEDIFLNLNELAYYTGGSHGFYNKCLGRLGANGGDGPFRFVHCEWLHPKFIEETNAVVCNQDTDGCDVVGSWISLLSKRDENLKKIRAQIASKGSEYLKTLTLKNVSENHVQRILYDYSQVPWEYCEMTFWNEANKEFSEKILPIQKLFLTVIKRSVLDSNTDIRFYNTFIKRFGLEEIDRTIKVQFDEYTVALAELRAIRRH